MDDELVKKLRTEVGKQAEAVNPKDRHAHAKLPMLSVVPPSAIIALASALRDGAEKYGSYNWRKTKVIASVYVDAALRHILAFFDGEEVATDSKVDHLAHAMATLAIIIDAGTVGKLEDDRPPKGQAAFLLDLLKRPILKERVDAPSELVLRSRIPDGGRVERSDGPVGHEWGGKALNLVCNRCKQTLAQIAVRKPGERDVCFG